MSSGGCIPYARGCAPDSVQNSGRWDEVFRFRFRRDRARLAANFTKLSGSASAVEEQWSGRCTLIAFPSPRAGDFFMRSRGRETITVVAIPHCLTPIPLGFRRRWPRLQPQ